MLRLISVSNTCGLFLYKRKKHICRVQRGRSVASVGTQVQTKTDRVSAGKSSHSDEELTGPTALMYQQQTRSEEEGEGCIIARLALTFYLGLPPVSVFNV